MTTTFFPSGEVAGLTDRPRMPRLGKIHLGVKAISAKGNEYPRATDFFVVPEVIQKVYGPKPRELDVVFPIDDVQRVAYVAWKNYTSTRGKVCTGDGERAVRVIDAEKLGRGPWAQEDFDAAIATADTKKWEPREILCPAHECVFAKRKHCKAVLNLQFLLPKVPGIGVWQLDTGSVNSIIDVRGGIEMVRKISGGRLAGIPLTLRLEPLEVISPDDGRKKVVFTLKLFSPATLDEIFQASTKSLGEMLRVLDHSGSLVALPATADVPAPIEPEDDLFPAAAPTDSFQDRSGQPSPAEEMSAHSASRTPAEGRPGAPLASPVDDVAIAAEIEELFHKLDVAPKDRALFRSGYKGRAAKLREMLRKQLAAKVAK